MEKWKIIDDIEEIQNQVDKMGFVGSNEKELWTRDLIADYIVKKLTIPDVVDSEAKLVCPCCKSRRIENDLKWQDNKCLNCGRIWVN